MHTRVKCRLSVVRIEVDRPPHVSARRVSFVEEYTARNDEHRERKKSMPRSDHLGLSLPSAARGGRFLDDVRAATTSSAVRAAAAAAA